MEILILSIISLITIVIHLILLLYHKGVIQGKHCPICHRNYTPQNIRTIHHVLPRRHWEGKVPKIILCRECHDELELIIRKKEKRRKRELTQNEYCHTVVLFLLDFVNHTKKHRNRKDK